jgi:hypothetical protein
VAEIQEIDSLTNALANAKIQLSKMDTGKANANTKQCEADLKVLFALKIPVDKEEAFVVDDYNNILKSYKKLSMRLPVLLEEIETVPRQLENLRKDLKNNLIVKEKAEKFVVHEHMAAEAVVTGINDISKSYSMLDQSFQVSREKILHLIQTLDTIKQVDPES